MTSSRRNLIALAISLLSLCSCDNSILDFKDYDYEESFPQNVMSPIDLGLSVKWADRYLSAEEVYCYCKSYWSWETNLTSKLLEEYNLMNSPWRVPTREECNELIEHCDWSIESIYDVKCAIGTSKANGNTICFPLAGYLVNNKLYYDKESAAFWSSDAHTADDAYVFWADTESNKVSVDTGPIDFSLSIRLVYDNQ